MADVNGGFHHKIAKYCANCGKPLFKWWISKQTETCIFLKLDIICNRSECKGYDSQFNNVEIKIDLLPKIPDDRTGIEVTV